MYLAGLRPLLNTTTDTVHDAEALDLLDDSTRAEIQHRRDELKHVVEGTSESARSQGYARTDPEAPDPPKDRSDDYMR